MTCEVEPEDKEARPASVASRKINGTQLSEQLAILRPITDQLGRGDFKEVNANRMAKDESTFKGVEQVLFWVCTSLLVAMFLLLRLLQIGREHGDRLLQVQGPIPSERNACRRLLF